MQPAWRTNLAETAVNNIRAEITANRWQVGDRILNEAALAGLLGVSRGTVRKPFAFSLLRASSRHVRAPEPTCDRSLMPKTVPCGFGEPGFAIRSRPAVHLKSRQHGWRQFAIRARLLPSFGKYWLTAANMTLPTMISMSNRILLFTRLLSPHPVIMRSSKSTSSSRLRSGNHQGDGNGRTPRTRHGRPRLHCRCHRIRRFGKGSIHNPRLRGTHHT